MILAVIGVALAAAIVTFLILLVVRPPARRVVSPPPSTQPSSSTSTTVPNLPTAPVLTAARLRALTAQLVPFVETTRMLKFTTAPTPVLDNDAAYGAAWRARLAETESLMTNLRIPFEALGLNPNGNDLKAAQSSFYGSNGVAFYDDVTNVLHVRAVPATPYVSASLVASLTEQLDDQHFTTDRVGPASGLGDPYLGLRTLVVGDGQRLASLWATSQSPTAQDEVTKEGQARFGSTNNPADVPPTLGEWLAFPSNKGGIYAASLVTSTSSAGLDAAFVTPPDGSAQAMDLNRFLSHVTQVPVQVPPADAPSAATGTLGKFFLAHALANVVDTTPLDAAMGTYAGDSLSAWETGGRACVRLDVSTGLSDPVSMNSALSNWAKKAKGTVTSIDDPLHPGQKLLRLDVCNPSSSSPPTTTAPPTTMPKNSGPTSSIPGGVPPI